MRMFAALIDTQIAELPTAKRATRQHSLHGFFDDTFGETALKNEFGGPFLDAALIAGVVVIDLLVALAASQNHFFGIDDDDVVAIVHMWREGWLVLAPQPQSDQRGKPSNDEPVGVNHHPFFFNVRSFGGNSLAEHSNFHANRRYARPKDRGLHTDWCSF